MEFKYLRSIDDVGYFRNCDMIGDNDIIRKIILQWNEGPMKDITMKYY